MTTPLPQDALDPAPDLRTSDLASEPVFLMARASSLGSASANRALGELDLKVRHYSALSLVCSGLHPSQRDLSRYLVLDPSQIVLIVDSLERRGAVVRRTDPSDRRSKLIEPTDEGRELYRRARAAVDRCTDRTLSPLSEDERATLLELLQRIALG
ncbi:MarR family winged helix-turn-helix transcriptional regulator [Kocuria marina]|uniref:MarR family winged helix-turn-helix transcriptional regulator n=1 Tax=Kocuria marina TaxID=223184 RepID=UPI0022E75211|nr:MarR family transcriptional regulator [Kocuria marina]